MTRAAQPAYNPTQITRPTTQAYQPLQSPQQASSSSTQRSSAVPPAPPAAPLGDKQMKANQLWDAAMSHLREGRLPFDGIRNTLPRFAEYITREQLSMMVSLLAVDLCRSDMLEVSSVWLVSCIRASLRRSGCVQAYVLAANLFGKSLAYASLTAVKNQGVRVPDHSRCLG